MQSLQKSLPSALSDNESKHAPTKSNEHDRLVVPVLSCLLSPPSSPIATATPPTLSTSTSLHQLFSIVARRLEMEGMEEERCEEPEEFDFISRTFIVSLVTAPETDLQAQPVYETVSPTLVTAPKEPACRPRSSQPLILATTVESLHPPPSQPYELTPSPSYESELIQPDVSPQSDLTQCVGNTLTIGLFSNEARRVPTGSDEHDRLAVPVSLCSSTHATSSASSTLPFSTLSQLLSIVARQLEEEEEDRFEGKLQEEEIDLVSRTFLITIDMSRNLTLPTQSGNDPSPSTIPAPPAESPSPSPMLISPLSPVTASPTQSSHNTEPFVIPAVSPPLVSMLTSPLSPASTLPIQPAHDMTSSAVPVPLAASPSA